MYRGVLYSLFDLRYFSDSKGRVVQNDCYANGIYNNKVHSREGR